MIFVELPRFTQRALTLLTDEELFRLQIDLVRRPEQGKLIRGSKGLRKVRMALHGRGKRGGARVIYVLYSAQDQIVLCSIYSKNEKETLSAADIASIQRELEG